MLVDGVRNDSASMYDAVHHVECSKVSSLLQSVAVNVCKRHLCDAAGMAVIVMNSKQKKY